jgi:hypothetical protein
VYKREALLSARFALSCFPYPGSEDEDSEGWYDRKLGIISNVY